MLTKEPMDLTKITKLKNLGYGYRRIAQELGLSERKVRDALAEIKKLSSVGDITVIMGDAHARQEESNRRFTIAGRFASAIGATRLISMGDWADMPSLSSYDKGKRSGEGQRYARDIEAAIDAQEKLLAELPVDIDLHMLGGNHDEARIARATNDDPFLFETLCLEDLRYEEFGWKYTPFREILTLDGVAYSHYFTAGRMDKPIGGEHQAANMLKKMHTSCVQGHSHVFDYKEDTLSNGKKIFGLVAGCFFEHEVTYVSRAEQRKWSRGLIVLRKYMTEHGDEFDIEKVSMDRLKELHG